MTAAGPEQVRLVPMRADHVDALMRYEQAMFGPEAWTRSGYRAELADTVGRYYVAAEGEDGSLLGWAGVLVVGGTADVLTVGVVPAGRRRGIGTRLLYALLDEARRRGAAEVLLEVRVDNAAARALYAREGFVELGIRPGYYDHGRVDGVVMRRQL